MDATLKTETNSTYRRYCPDCKRKVEPKIENPNEARYTGEDASMVVCPDCGTGLGVATWWPTEDR